MSARVLFCAYREWALKAFEELSGRLEDCELVLATTPTELEELAGSGRWDAVVVVGWSWRVPAEVVNEQLVVGVHPSDLPRYAGGSPIQHQVVDGVRETKATLFRLTEDLDGGDIVARAPLVLDGHMAEILDRLAAVSVELVAGFVRSLPDVRLEPQSAHGEGFRRARLQPEDSRLVPSDFAELTCEQLYDRIRAREDPYPNAFLEDDTGTLRIRWVEFEPGKGRS